MAEIQLPSATSVVDFLKTQGKDSSFGARKKIFTDLGLDKRLGTFQGASNQNTALLRELQRQSQAEVPRSSEVGLTGSLFGAPTSPSVGASNIVTPPSFPSLSSTLGRTGINVGKIGGQTTPAFIPPKTASAPVAPAAPKDLTPPAPAAPATPAPATPTIETGKTEVAQTPEVQQAQAVDESTKSSVGLSASDLYPDIFGASTPSEAELINQYLNSAEGKLFLERQDLSQLDAEAKAEATKAALEAKYQSELSSLDEKLAARGLASSGIRGSAVKALADSLAASQLGADRELASKLLDANLELREAILEGVADIVKEAQAGRKEAIQQLNNIGFAVVGDQLVPTLAAQREERALRAEERSARSLELSERRLELAEQSAARAEERLFGDDKYQPASTGGIANRQIEKDIREDTVALLGEIDFGNITLEEGFKRLRTLYAPDEVTDSAIYQLLGLEAVGQETPEAEALLPGELPVFELGSSLGGSSFGGSFPSSTSAIKL